MIEELWEAAIAGAKRLPESMLHERVDGEWSFVQTQRHLLFASDAWLGNAVLEEESPYHALGLPSGAMPADVWRNSGSRWTQLRPSTTCWNCACCAWHVCAG